MHWFDNPTEWLAAIVESSDDAIVGKTLDSIIRSWNTGAERMFGYSADEIIGRSVLTLIPPELHDEERQIVSRLSKGQRIDHFETIRVRKDRSRFDVSLSVSPIRDKSGSVIGAAKIARDITETNRLRQAERDLSEELRMQAVELEQQMEHIQDLQAELEESNDELRQALGIARNAQTEAEDANRAKAKFLAMMSHELRTPLNAIAGYVDLLQLGVRGPLTPEQALDLERVRTSQQALTRLVEEVLGFAKLESGRMVFTPSNVPIDAVLQTLEQFVAPSLLKKGLELRFEPCGSDAIAYADRGKIEQIMINLVSNAIKFTDRGGVTVRCLIRGSWLEVEVVDTGRGVPPELAESIFEPFVQGDINVLRRAEGTGLGLAIARELARGMGGDVTLRSDGNGSVFTLRVPRAQ